MKKGIKTKDSEVQVHGLLLIIYWNSFSYQVHDMQLGPSTHRLLLCPQKKGGIRNRSSENVNSPCSEMTALIEDV